ncbi:MAG: PHP domain-containing protein [Oscillospiraceae bacterium]|nr:PHP domain-containing protein [Oscillospiraceae bacterium]
MKFDLHVHTTASSDSIMETEELYAAAAARGIDGIAVTNHDVLEKVESRDGIFVIPAIEVSTDAGHILIYFAKEDICKKLRKNERGVFLFSEVVREARAQGALIFAAHPFSPEIPREDAVWEALDGVELFNSRIVHSRIFDANERALSLCREKKLAFSAGSDAHSKEEVGAAFIELDLTRDDMTSPDFEEKFKAALLSRKGKVFAGYNARKVVFSCKRKSYLKRKLYKKLIRSYPVCLYLWLRDIIKGKKRTGYIEIGVK